jgi:hypothetical protein
MKNWKDFSFYTELLILHKMSADNMSLHKWEKIQFQVQIQF